MKGFFSLTVLSLAVAYHAVAQLDSSFVDNAAKSSREAYAARFQKQSHLYNGPVYKDLPQTNDGHPFFMTDDWMPAEVAYDGEVFSDVDVQYDLVNDRLIIEYFNGTKIALINELLRSFSIGEKTFVGIAINNAGAGLPKDGIYELVYGGPSQCLARWEKRSKKEIETQRVKILYLSKETYYVKKGSAYHPVSSKAGFLRLFKEEKAALKAFIRKSNLSFRRDKHRAFHNLLAYYDSHK